MQSDLRSYVIHKTLSNEQQIEIALKISNNLNGIHRSGIVHNDIKLENILVGDSDEIAITDFEHAQEFEKEEKETVGSMAYLSPERAQKAFLGDSNVPGTVASDIYSLGLVLYALKYKMQPQARLLKPDANSLFLDHGAIAIIGERGIPENYFSEEYRNRDQTNNAYDNLIAQMLSIDPVLRPSMQEIIEKLTEMHSLFRSGGIWKALSRIARVARAFCASGDVRSCG